MSDVFSFTPSNSGKCCECKGNVDNSWYCQNCESNLCTSCKKLHLEKLISWHHHIVQSDQLIRDRNTYNVYCNRHPDQKYKFCCEDCDVAVCNDCVITNHQRHKFTTLRNAISIRKRDITRYTERLEGEILPRCKLDELSATNDLDKYNSEISSVTERIEAQRDEFKAAADSICDTMLDYVNNVKRDNVKVIEMVQKSLQLKHSHVKNLITTCKIKTESDSLDMIEFAGERSHLSSMYPAGTYEPSLPTYIPGQISASEIQRMFGSLSTTHVPIFQNTTAGISVRTLNIEIKNTLNINTPVNSMKILSDTLFLASSLNRPFLNIFGLDGICRDSMVFDCAVDNFTCSDSHDYILGLPTEDRIAKVTKTGIVKTLCHVDCPRDVCINQDQQIVVCLINQKKLEIYSKDGNMRLGEISQDEHGQPLFEQPFRLIQNKNGDYCVIDILKVSSKQDRLVTVSKQGQLRWVYNGSRTGHRKKFSFFDSGFLPRGVCCDRYQNVIVSDYKNNLVDLLDKDGNFLMFLLTPSHGIHKPLAMDTDEDGKLWIGQYDGTIRIVKYLN